MDPETAFFLSWLCVSAATVLFVGNQIYQYLKKRE